MLTTRRNLIAGAAALAAALMMLLSPVQAQSARRLLPFGVPGWVKPGAAADLDFANGRYFGCSLASCLSITRASTKTNLLPSSASGFAYTTFANNTLAITPGSGVLIEESRTNQLLNSAVPATQTTASLATGTYTLWVNGSGSATMSAGTGTGCGTSAASQGTSVSFTITVAGTCTVTVSGSLNAFQLELGSFGTSLIVTAGATATRAADNVTAAGLLLSTIQGTAYSITTRTALEAANVNNTRVIGYTPNDEAFTQGTATTVTANSSGTVLTATAPSGDWTTARTMGLAANASGRSLVFAGGSVVSDSGGPGNRSIVRIGGYDGSSLFSNGYFLRVTAWNSKISNGALQSATNQ